ncbi:MAG: GntR family transcriptional regulator [Bacteroidota bacterium]
MNLAISLHNPTPIYRQIIDQIEIMILTGEIRSGEPLPSLRQLAEDLMTSVITTKRAYAELEAEGLIVTRPGLGTFVAEQSTDARRRLREDLILTHLRRAVEMAKTLGVNREELTAMLQSLLDHDGGG